MQCDRCRDEAVIFKPYSGRHLCGRHLARDIEARAKRSIRSHRWIRSGDHIAVVLSGDRKSAALLCFLKKLTFGRRDIHLGALLSGEDGAGMSAAAKVAESLRIPCVETMACGSMAAASDPVTRIACAISLDDIAQDLLREFLFGNADRLLHFPSAGPDPIPVICPFISIPSDELDLYWEIEEGRIGLIPSVPPVNHILQETGTLLEDYCRGHPATKFALLHLAEQLGGGNAAMTAEAGAVSPGRR